MTKIVDVYGPDALHTHDFIGWLKSDEGILFRGNHEYSDSQTIEEIGWMLSDAYHQHGLQPMNKEMFVRAQYIEKDSKGHPSNPKEVLKEINWQPLFAGEISDYREESFFENVKDHTRYKFKFNGSEWMFRSNEKGIWKLSGNTWYPQGNIMNDFLTDNKGLNWNTKFELK